MSIPIDIMKKKTKELISFYEKPLISTDKDFSLSVLGTQLDIYRKNKDISPIFVKPRRLSLDISHHDKYTSRRPSIDEDESNRIYIVDEEYIYRSISNLIIKSPAKYVSEPIIEPPAKCVPEQIIESPAKCVPEPIIESPAKCVPEQIIESPAKRVSTPITPFAVNTTEMSTLSKLNNYESKSFYPSLEIVEMLPLPKLKSYKLTSICPLFRGYFQSPLKQKMIQYI